MGTGLKGTFVIPWSQTEIDGLQADDMSDPVVGVTWRWTGKATRVDGPGAVAQLTGAAEIDRLHAKAATAARKMVQSIPEVERLRAQAQPGDAEDFETGFVVSDGQRVWTALAINEPGGARLAAFADDLPPAGKELWIVKVAQTDRAQRAQRVAMTAGGVICFTKGTLIATPQGDRPVEDLGEGDHVLTKDNGAQPVQWRGARRMTGARLFAMPALRPIRIRAGALGPDEPDGDLLVSPSHRLLIQGPAARALFNTSEVLVKARDLDGVPGISTDVTLREATYVHLMLDSHEILFANGVASESFHPAEANFATLDAADRVRLLEAMPALEAQPESYGPMARRALSAGEAAILRHDVRLGG